MRALSSAVLIVLALAAARAAPDQTCAARVDDLGGLGLRWHQARDADADALDAWCRGVGPPVITDAPAAADRSRPELAGFVVATWNVHLAEGRLPEFVRDLRAGAFTDGTPADHFALLLQETIRSGPSVPAFADDARTAGAIRGASHGGPDIVEHARALGLALAYVPSMRNGADAREDRGNAILSTLPLLDVLAIELPFTRQRRVSTAARVELAVDGEPIDLHLMNVHLDALGSARSLWLFGNPRRGQMEAVLRVWPPPLADPMRSAAILGGDLNAVRAGVDEAVYQDARRWATSLATEDDRATHLMGRLDYLFFKLFGEWKGHTRRVDDRYGSDHHPVVGRLARGPLS